MAVALMLYIDNLEHVKPLNEQLHTDGPFYVMKRSRGTSITPLLPL